MFLDRDGVINKKAPEGQYVRSWDEFYLLPKAAEAIARLNRAGIRAVVATNQRGIAKGLYAAADVEAIHAALQDLLAGYDAHLDGFFFCPHDKNACHCRKPLPGLFEQAVAAFPEITAATSAMIGDSWVDMEFGRRLGMRTILIEDGREHRKAGDEEACRLAGQRFPSLDDAVDALLSAET